MVRRNSALSILYNLFIINMYSCTLTFLSVFNFKTIHMNDIYQITSLLLPDYMDFAVASFLQLHLQGCFQILAPGKPREGVPSTQAPFISLWSALSPSRSMVYTQSLPGTQCLIVLKEFVKKNDYSCKDKARFLASAFSLSGNDLRELLTSTSGKLTLLNWRGLLASKSHGRALEMVLNSQGLEGLCLRGL